MPSASQSSKPKRFPIVIYIVALLVILAGALAPVGCVAVAGTIAERHGCRLDEGGIYPCIINGSDWGSTLATLSMMGWFMLATLPVGAFALLVWLIALIAHWASWRRKRRAANNPAAA